MTEATRSFAKGNSFGTWPSSSEGVPTSCKSRACAQPQNPCMALSLTLVLKQYVLLLFSASEAFFL